jgi:hypothetical protein
VTTQDSNPYFAASEPRHAVDRHRGARGGVQAHGSDAQQHHDHPHPHRDHHYLLRARLRLVSHSPANPAPTRVVQPSTAHCHMLNALRWRGSDGEVLCGGSGAASRAVVREGCAGARSVRPGRDLSGSGSGLPMEWGGGGGGGGVGSQRLLRYTAADRGTRSRRRSHAGRSR